MTVAGCLECVFWVGCYRWAAPRLAHAGANDSAHWPSAAVDDFSPVPRACRAILAAYDSPNATTHCPPYTIGYDPDHHEVVVAVCGLNLVRESDYRILLDDRPGMQALHGGYAHHGLFKAAKWLIDREEGAIRRLLRENGPGCQLVLTGHSLGAGVASLATVLIVDQLDRFGGIPRSKVRCYAMAPPRCMSLGLAVEYADVINSVVLQDDFLPRIPTPLQLLFGSVFCLPCLLTWVCVKDTFVSQQKKLQDPKRLYAPGRIFHIVERKFCSCARLPPEVRTAIPVEGRFEHVVLSCTATSDHAILWIEKEAQKALDRMQEEVEVTDPPMAQTMERENVIVKDADQTQTELAIGNPPVKTTLMRNALVTAEQFSSQDLEAAVLLEDPKSSSISLQLLVRKT